MRFLDRLIANARVKSPWVLHYDAGACNGCDIEILACLTPVYDVERFGIINVGNPKHADVLVVTGTVNNRSARVLRNLYDQMPDPKVVVAVGACALSGGIFHECYNVLRGVSNVLPVDAYVPGCAARPEAIIEGIVMALGRLGKEDPGPPVVVMPSPEDGADAAPNGLCAVVARETEDEVAHA